MDQNRIEIYTDGACSGNPGPGGWAFAVIVNGNLVHEESGHAAHTTNQQMELTAARNALRYLDQHIAQDHQIPSGSTVIVYSDSMYLRDGITSWIHNWKRNGWRTSSKKDVSNKELWVAIDQLAHLVSEWSWVKGHAGNPYNERVDQLAQEASRGLVASTGQQRQDAASVSQEKHQKELIDFREFIASLRDTGMRGDRAVFREFAIPMTWHDEIALRYLVNLIEEMRQEPIASIHHVIDNMKWWLITLDFLRLKGQSDPNSHNEPR